MIESNFLTLGGGGYQYMELVIAYALTILVTIAVIVLGSHRKQIEKIRAPQGVVLITIV